MYRWRELPARDKSPDGPTSTAKHAGDLGQRKQILIITDHEHGHWFSIPLSAARLALQGSIQGATAPGARGSNCLFMWAGILGF